MIEIRPATPTDRPGIVALLNASDLPLEGLDEALEAVPVGVSGVGGGDGSRLRSSTHHRHSPTVNPENGGDRRPMGQGGSVEQ